MSGKYIVKENLPFGEDYLSYTVSEKATDCYRTFTGTEADCNIEKLNKLLAERYGSVKCPSGAKPVYEIVKITAGRWHCEHCRIDIVQNKTDCSRFSVITADGDVMGEFFRQDIGSIVQTTDMLDSGECPVCGSWNDGLGNTCSPVGWGKTEFFYKNCRLITKSD